MKHIHTLFILDRSGSMLPYKSRTLESLNSNLESLRVESKKAGVKVYNTLMTFASTSSGWDAGDGIINESDFLYPRIMSDVDTIVNLTDNDYSPEGGTPLLDAIGLGIERLKKELGDSIGSDDVSILVTIFTDGSENSSTKYTKPQIKTMIDHFSADKKWTFAFVGCGSLDNVSATSGQLGISAKNTLAFDATNTGYTHAYSSYSTCCRSFINAVATNTSTDNLFAKKNDNSTPAI